MGFAVHSEGAKERHVVPWNKRSRTQDTGLRAWRTPHTGRAVEPEGGHMAGSPRERAEKGGVVYKEFTNDNTADRESDSCPPAPRVDGSDGVRGVMLGRTRWTPRPATGAVGAGRAGVGRAPRRAPGHRALGPVMRSAGPRPAAWKDVLGRRLACATCVTGVSASGVHCGAGGNRRSFPPVATVS